MKGKFLTVGTGLVLIITLLNIAGWVESLEAKDMYKHCQKLYADEVFTDQEAADMDKACADKVFKNTGQIVNRGEL